MYTKSSKTTKVSHILCEDTMETYCGVVPSPRWIRDEEATEKICERCSEVEELELETHLEEVIEDVEDEEFDNEEVLEEMTDAGLIDPDHEGFDEFPSLTKQEVESILAPYSYMDRRYQSKKGGYEFIVIAQTLTTVKLKWEGEFSYKRDVRIEALSKHYVEMDFEGEGVAVAWPVRVEVAR